MRAERRVLWVLGLALSPLISTGAARGAILYTSGGFEAPNFSTTFTLPLLDPTVVGNLRGQDAANSIWRESTTDPNGSEGSLTGTAVVENKAGGSGADLQDVKMTRTQYDNRFSPVYTYTQNLTNPIVKIDWTMKVEQTTTDLTKFGPFFGIEAYDASNSPPGPALRIGGLGVDATTGEVLFEDPVFGGFNITPLDDTVPFDQYQNFEMTLNYGSHTYSASVNGSTLVSAVPFFTNGVVALTDADISALQAADDADANQTGTAYFDNYSVSAVPAPEPASLGLFAVAALAFTRRRRAL